MAKKKVSSNISFKLEAKKKGKEEKTKKEAKKIKSKKPSNKKLEKKLIITKKESKVKPKLEKKRKEKKAKPKSHKEAIEKILEGIKQIEYETQKKKIIEKEPHIEHIITPSAEKKMLNKEEKEEKTTIIPSYREKRKLAKIEKEIEEVSYAQPEKEIGSIRTLATIKKPRVELEKPNIIKTGIPGFDEMCGGGIEEKSIILINGDAGSGKTIFGLQFLYEGAKNGEAGLFISFGEPRSTLYPRMLSFGMNFQELEDKHLFFFLEYQPHEVAKIMQEEGGTLYDIITSYNIKRVVVDPITPYLMQFNEAYNARLALVRLFSVFRKFQVTTMLLNEWSSELPVHPSTAVAEFLADGIVYLIHRRSPEGIQLRGVEIWKMTGVGHTEVARPFAFTPKGIVIYPNERLFFGSSQKKL